MNSGFRNSSRPQQQRRPCRLFALAAGASAVAAAISASGFVGFGSRQTVSRQTRVGKEIASAGRFASLIARAANDKDSECEQTKTALMDLLQDDSLAKEVLRPEGKPMRGRVDELIVALEKYNKNDEPAYSEGLDGIWTVKYTGTYAPGLLSSPTRELALFLYGGGFSVGNALTSFADGFWGQQLGVEVMSKKVEIRDGRDVDAEAELSLPGGKKQTLKYTAELMPLSARRLSEEVISFDLPAPIGKRDAPFEMRRGILVTYMDEDTMIVRDESGVPEVLTKEAMPVLFSEEEPIADAVPEENATAPVEAEAGKPQRRFPWSPRKDAKAPAADEETPADEGNATSES